MEVVRSSKSPRSGALDAQIDRVSVNIFNQDVVSIMRRSLNGKDPGPRHSPRPGPRSASRPGPRSRAKLDRNAVEVVDPDAPDVAVVVLGGDARSVLGSPPPLLDESPTDRPPANVVEIPSEEDVIVETRPDAMNPLTDHNYEVNVKVEVDEMLSDMDDGGLSDCEVAKLSEFPAATNVHLEQEVDGEDEEIDVELDDDSSLGVTPEPPAHTPDAVKSEPPSSPESSATLEAAPPPVAAAPVNGKALRPGWRECPICGVAVMGVMGYRDHMLALHLRAQPYRCMQCWKSFTLAEYLVRHTNNNCAEVFYKCQRCDRTWSSDRHHASCETCAAAGGDGPVVDKDSVYQCAACSRTFPLLRHLTAHVKTHPGVDKPFQCHTCGQRYKHSVRLMIHIRSHVMSPSKRGLAATRPRAAPSPAAPSPAPKRARNGGGGGGGSTTPSKPPSTIPRAALAYANPAFILKMEPPEPHSDDEFGEHAAAFDDDDYHDDIFKDAVGLDDDGEEDVDDDFEDDVDGDADGDREAMMENMMGGVAVGDAFPASWKRYKCKWCTKTFRFSHQVGVHMRTHTGERPYCCRLCDQQFRQSNHLKRHLYGNHGLAGADANQAFRSMIALKRRRQQRERFRALTAFFAKQGGFKGFGPSTVDVAGAVDLLINRGFDKDLSGRGKAGKMAREEHFRRIGNPSKPWVNLGKVNGLGAPAAPAAPATSAAVAGPATPAAANGRPAANGGPSPPNALAALAALVSSVSNNHSEENGVPS